MQSLKTSPDCAGENDIKKEKRKVNGNKYIASYRDQQDRAFSQTHFTDYINKPAGCINTLYLNILYWKSLVTGAKNNSFSYTILGGDFHIFCKR